MGAKMARSVESAIESMGFVTVEKAAKELEMTKGGVYHLMKTGHLKGRKFMRYVVIKEGSLVRLKAARARAAAPPKEKKVRGRRAQVSAPRQWISAPKFLEQIRAVFREEFQNFWRDLKFPNNKQNDVHAMDPRKFGDEAPPVRGRGVDEER